MVSVMSYVQSTVFTSICFRIVGRCIVFRVSPFCNVCVHRLGNGWLVCVCRVVRCLVGWLVIGVVFPPCYSLLVVFVFLFIVSSLFGMLKSWRMFTCISSFLYSSVMVVGVSLKCIIL